MFPNELIDLHKSREKEILDKWIETKGIDAIVKPVKVEDNGAIIAHDLDPFNIEIGTVGYEDGSIMEYDNEYKAKLIIANEQFQFLNVSFDIMVEEYFNDSDSSNMNELYCFIEGGIVPKSSIISFENFDNISMRVESIMKKRPLSDIYRYRLVRC